ncbi:RNA polymerase II transcription factor B subunit 5, putative [Acanthamoeba castellanii str. Neff]|uniref:General transcription and DNA repair factor IIH subunit TFB5 n=1 Tax=Acanthamoeba castellanii (strain ATCC 30010 / Neff) TaxID=1257118 RepID=L8HDL6_ACACF|nr:RNA polymerase II transcription factor B subunit 5, putative [Acanthamoeba castellanii str. Neff]ELR23285.1 RNA polymerase II transcription factor B subunit 5, putative [Acanthamoeba castellanii str. Neff]
MVHATKGVLVTCDATMKQFLLFLDKEHHFIIKDLDETHLLVDAAKATLIQEKMNEMYEENTYVPIKTDN